MLADLKWEGWVGETLCRILWNAATVNSYLILTRSKLTSWTWLHCLYGHLSSQHQDKIFLRNHISRIETMKTQVQEGSSRLSRDIREWTNSYLDTHWFCSRPQGFKKIWIKIWKHRSFIHFVLPYCYWILGKKHGYPAQWSPKRELENKEPPSHLAPPPPPYSRRGAKPITKVCWPQHISKENDYVISRGSWQEIRAVIES